VSDAQKPVDDEIIKEIERAIADHCTGGDLWLCAKLGKDRIKRLLAPPKLTPPDGWADAVAIAEIRVKVLRQTSDIYMMSQAILDMDAILKQQTKQPDD
jgi:hypothetical protein